MAGQSQGLDGLVKRTNFLKGLTMDRCAALVKNNDYLRPGARELFAWFRDRGIISIIASGNLVPILELYQAKLGADYVVGSRPRMIGNAIDSISEADYSGVDFKVRDCRAILDKLGIGAEALAVGQVAAIGDSRADQGLFQLVAPGPRIAINPRGGIEQHADYVIQDDLGLVIPILEKLMV